MLNKVLGVAKRRSVLSRVFPLVLGIVVLGLGYLIYRSAPVAESELFGGIEASKHWQAGESAYAERSFDGRAPETPMFLMLLVPFTRLDVSTAELVWVGASLLFLLHGMWLISRMLGYEGIALGPRVARSAPWLALLLVAPFVVGVVSHRRSTLVAMWLTLMAIEMLARRRDSIAGGVLGLAAAIHVIPCALAGWLLYKRRWAAAGVFAGSLLGFAVLPLVYPGQGVDRRLVHYSEYAAAFAQGAGEESLEPNRQSLRPFVLASIAPDIEGEQDWDGSRNFLASDSLFSARKTVVSGLSLALIVLCVLWIRSGHNRFPSDFILLGETGLVIGTMLLVSPFSQADDYVWLLPGIVFLFGSAFGGARRCRLRSGMALAVAGLFLTLPNETAVAFFASSLGQTWLGYHGLAVATFVVLLLLGWTLRGEASIRGVMALRETAHDHDEEHAPIVVEKPYEAPVHKPAPKRIETPVESVDSLLPTPSEAAGSLLDLNDEEAAEAIASMSFGDDDEDDDSEQPLDLGGGAAAAVLASMSFDDDEESQLDLAAIEAPGLPAIHDQEEESFHRHALPEESGASSAPGFPDGPPAVVI